jgi:hypothetical protein
MAPGKPGFPFPKLAGEPSSFFYPLSGKAARIAIAISGDRTHLGLRIADCVIIANNGNITIT